MTVLNLLAEAGADVNTPVGGFTPLMKATKTGNSNCVKCLTDAGADVNKSMSRTTALILAAEQGHSECLQHLIGAGAHLNICIKDQTALIIAAGNGNSQCVEYLIAAGADLNKYGHSECRGCNTGAKDYSCESKGTALMAAAENGHLECLQYLIEGGADVNICVRRGTALMLAAENLIEGGADVNKGNMKATKQGDSKFLRILIQAGADINRKPSYQDTALLMTVRKEHIQCLQDLIQAGADVNKRGRSHHESPLHVALKSGNKEIMKLLIEAGADRWGNDLLCCFSNNVEDVKALLLAGAHVNLCDKKCSHRKPPERAIRLLFGAGDRFKKIKRLNITIPDDLKAPVQMNLQHLCRVSIRNHLLQMSNVNLLYRIPQMGLPFRLQDYLLYGVSPSAVKQ